MRLGMIVTTSAVAAGLILLGGCSSSSSSSSSSDGTTASPTITVDLVRDYIVVDSDMKLTLGTPCVINDVSGKRFLHDYAYDSGFDTRIMSYSADGSGEVRLSPTMDNGYKTDIVALVTWSVDSDGKLIALGSTGNSKIVMTPINDTSWPSSEMLIEYNDLTQPDTNSTAIRYPASFDPATDFDSAVEYANDCASCHGVTVPGDLTGFTADTLEVRMIRIKDDSDLTGKASMDDLLDVYTVGELRLLAEYITAP